MLAAASPTTTKAWIDGTAATAAPYTVTWADSSTSATTGYTNWLPANTMGTNTMIYIDSAKNGQWTVDAAASTHANICQKTPA